MVAVLTVIIIEITKTENLLYFFSVTVFPLLVPIIGSEQVSYTS